MTESMLQELQTILFRLDGVIHMPIKDKYGSNMKASYWGYTKEYELGLLEGARLLIEEVRKREDSDRQ